MQANPGLLRALRSLLSKLLAVVLGPGIPASAVAASVVSFDAAPDLAKAALVFLNLWVVFLALIVYLPIAWHERRVEVDLTPSSGTGPDIRLQVRNRTKTRDHWARARILETRNGAEPRSGVYAVPWLNAPAQRVSIQHDDSEPLLVAQWSANHNGDPAGLISVMEIGPAPLAGSSHANFDQQRWFHGDKLLPEIDLEISVYADGVRRPRVQVFTLAPEKMFGPLKMTAKRASL